MRIEIGHKFYLSFIIVVGAIVGLSYLVPLLGIPPQWHQTLVTAWALLVGLLLGWAFSKGFTTNVGVLCTGARRISKGDLREEISLKKNIFEDETTDLSRSLNEVVLNLRELLIHISESAGQVNESSCNLSCSSEQMSSAAGEVAKSIDQIRLGAETQAEIVEGASRTIKEMAMSINLVASSSQKVADSADTTALCAQKGGEMAETAIKKMKLVLTEVERGTRQFVSFGSHVQQIGKMVDVITSMAEKTNLLALNATIEAARAGEAGRGFAVVAEEVSKLADSSAASASEITDLVERIREENLEVQHAMKSSIAEISAGHEAIDTTGAAFGEIIETALITRNKATSICELSRQQTQRADDMVEVIDRIAALADENAAATEEVSSATLEQSASMEEMALSAQALSELAHGLTRRVKHFELPGAGTGHDRADF